jgi:hypothetical protein
MQYYLSQVRRHPAFPPLTRALFVLVLVVLAWQLTALWHGYQFGSIGTKDFIEYWGAGQLLRYGQSPYDFGKLCQLEANQGVPREAQVVMWNPPWLLVWILPLLLLSFSAAALTWLAFSGVIIFGSGSALWRTFAACSPPNRALPAAWIATLVFLPTLSTLRMGQVSGLLLLGVAGFLCSVSRGRDFVAGAFLALATVKPHVLYLLWIVMVWWVIWEKRWKVMAGFSAVMLPTVATLTLLWSGWLTGYRAAIANPPLYWSTPTLGGMLRVWVFTDTPTAQFLPSLVLGSVVLGYLLVKRPSLGWRSILSPLLLASVPTAAYGWSFDQVVLLVPYLEVIRWVAEGRIRGTGERVLVMGGLVTIVGGMLGQNLLVGADYFFFWVPFAIAGVYVFAWFFSHPRRWCLAPGAPNPEDCALPGGLQVVCAERGTKSAS